MSSTPGDRRARRQAARDARKASEPEGSSTPRWLVPGLIVAAVVVAGILAIVLPGSNPPSSGGSSSIRPSVSAAAGASASGGASAAPTASSGSVGGVQEPTITGGPLPELPRDGTDPAAGLPVPQVEGTDFTGKPVAITADGRPKVLLFLAHWCPHCQAEVPVIQQWVNGGGLPDGVDLVSVATGIDPNAPNYPPDAWLQREGWTSPVLVDPSNKIAQAYGLPAYPYFVFVGSDGKVVSRAIGAPQDLDAIVGRLAGS
jgi:cytochrome c biogenesis protein CcmG/thiol:disulfide interchange protein DsbE